MDFNKYTYKLLNYLESHDIQKYSHNFFNNIFSYNFIKNLYKLISVKSFDKTIIKSYALPPVHQVDEYPLIYLLFNKYNLKEMSFKDFIKWFNLNSHSLNYKFDTSIMDQDTRDIFNFIFKNKSREELHKIIYDNPFISLDVQQYFETNNIIINKYKLANFDITIFGENDLINKINIDLIFNIIEIMGKLVNYKSTKNNQINILLSNQKKEFTSKNLLTSQNINSGSSIKSINVNVWRFEEVYKVLIHELVHFFGLDYNIYTHFDNLENNVNNLFCFDGKNNINESYTEFIAIIIHTMIISKYTNLEFDKLLEKELSFSLFQCAKILKYFEFENINELFDNKICSKKINQTTSVISYFIIKTALLVNFNEILQYLDDHNIIIDTDHEHKLENIILKSIRNNKFIELINQFMTINFIKNDKHSGFALNTLRMSLLGF
jgi:hypothetical protein